jgi:hypothetical protein
MGIFVGCFLPNSVRNFLCTVSRFRFVTPECTLSFLHVRGHFSNFDVNATKQLFYAIVVLEKTGDQQDRSCEKWRRVTCSRGVKRRGEERNILHSTERANWTGHILRRNCFLKHVIEGKLAESTEMTGRRRKQQVMDSLKQKRRYWKLKEEALDRTVWRTRFGRGYAPVVDRLQNVWNDTSNCINHKMWPHVSTNYMVILRPLGHVKPKLKLQISFWVRIFQNCNFGFMCPNGLRTTV